MLSFYLSYSYFYYDFAFNKFAMISTKWLYTSEMDTLPVDKHSLYDATNPPIFLSVLLSNPKNNFLLSSLALIYNY